MSTFLSAAVLFAVLFAVLSAIGAWLLMIGFGIVGASLGYWDSLAASVIFGLWIQLQTSSRSS